MLDLAPDGGGRSRRLERVVDRLEAIVVEVEVARAPPSLERKRRPQERRVTVGVEVIAVGGATAVVEEDRVLLASQDVLEEAVVRLASYFGNSRAALARFLDHADGMRRL